MRSGSTRSAPHIVYDSGDYALLLDKALQLADWDALQGELSKRRARRREGRRRLRHVRREERAGPVRYRRKSKSKPDGSVEVVTGVASVGQGIETAMAQICADALGVDYSDISVVHGQTDRIERGMGAFASRVTVMCGEAPAGRGEVARTCSSAGRRTDADARRRSSTSSDGKIVRSGRFLGSVDAARRTGAAAPGCTRRGHLRVVAHGLSLRRAHRRRAHRRRDRRRRGRALRHRLRHRPRGQSDAGRRPDRRRPGARHRRRAVRGVSVRRASASRCRSPSPIT